MKNKYLKIKLILLISLIFCIVGASGSAMLLLNMIDNATKYIISNTKMETTEVYRSKEKIEAIDLSDFNGDTIVVEKSVDGENSIEVKYNSNIKKIKIEKNKLYPEKLDLIPEYKEKQNSRTAFNFVESVVTDYIYEKRGTFLVNVDGNFKNEEKVIIKLTEPSEIIIPPKYYGYKSNIDTNLIKKELHYKYYEENILHNIIFDNGEYFIKEYGKSKFYIENTKIKNRTKINVDFKNMNYLQIAFNESKGHFVFDLKNIEKSSSFIIESDNPNTEFDIQMKNGKNISIDIPDKNLNYVIRYKVGDEMKEYVISGNEDSEKINKILIDAESINYYNEGTVIKLK